nr:replicative DNA helicase [Lachnospiraceae bacterium]
MDENVIRRVLPNSTEAERSVIGSMLLDRDAISKAADIITGEDFYNKQCGILFDTMVELNEQNQPVDLVTLQNKLREKAVPDEVASLEYIKEFIDIVPTSANIRYYANIVYEKAVLRRLIHLTEDISNDCYSGKDNLESILEKTEKNVFKLVSKRNTGDIKPIKKVVLDAINNIEQASKQTGSVTGIPSGFIDLDYKTAGFQKSDLVLIAARPSMGKTAFVLNIAQNVAIKNKYPVAIFSLEMSSEMLVNRLFSLESGVDAQKLRTGQLNDRDWENLIPSAGAIAGSKLIIDDTPGISVSELRSKCRKIKLEQGLSMIII